jgi:hypothetical protein
MAKSFKLCAMHYLTMWWETDRRFIKNFSRHRIEPAALREMCIAYGVNRNVSGRGAKRYTQFATMLQRYQRIRIPPSKVPSVVEKELDNMREAYGESVLSAITKALWMLKGHPVVVYDNFACQGLRESGLSCHDRNYAEYFAAWFEFFSLRDTQRSIGDAQEWLLCSDFVRSLAKEWNLSWDETREFIGSERFRNRVLDKYLWHLGKERER